MRTHSLLLLALLLLPSQCWGWGALFPGAHTNSSAGAPAGCNIGITADPNTSAGSVAAGCAVATLFTAGCSGTPTIGYSYHGNTNAIGVRYCIYLDDGDSIIDAGDTLKGCTVTGPSSAVEWHDLSDDDMEALSQGSNYWLVVFAQSGGTAYSIGRQASGYTSKYNTAGCNGYAGDITDLSSCGTWYSSTMGYNVYVTIP